MDIVASFDGLRFIIQEDKSTVGVYLYVYNDNKCIRDDLQIDIATCQLVALEEYGVPLDRWTTNQHESNDQHGKS